MVYRGKPSASCGECRKRRSRCDQVLPGCGQCYKAGRACPGYRNILGLMFHDESIRVAKRSKRLSAPKHVTTIAKEQQRKERSVQLPNIILLPSLDDLAIHFFMSNYVGTDPALQQMAYLPHFYQTIGHADPALRQSIVASGLAGYGRLTGRRDLLNVATKTYVTTIQAINAAISKPATGIQDSTVLSIVLAALYESMITSEVSGMDNVCKHLKAAVYVAYYRLQQSPPSPLTQNLYVHLVQAVIMNCWIQHVPLPPYFMGIMKYASNQNSIHSRFLNILLWLIQFRHGLRDGSYTCARIIMEHALQIDRLLEDFARNLPKVANFEKFWICSDENSEVRRLVYGEYYHIYPVHFVAHLWDNVRSSRLYLHQVIHRQCHINLAASPSSGVSSIENQILASERLMTSLAMDICATVPQLLGYSAHLSVFSKSARKLDSVRPKRDPSSDIDPIRDSLPVRLAPLRPKSTSSSIDVVTAASKHTFMVLPRPDHVSAYQLLFSIYTIPSMAWLPSSLKEWVLGRIDWIEHNVDGREFARLTEMIRKRPANGFPVSESKGLVSHGSVCESIASDAEDQRLWLLAHSWFFVGLNWT